MKNEFLKSHEEMQLEDFCHALNRENNIIQDQLTEYRIKHEIACSIINLLQKKCDVRGKALSLQCKETKELQQQLADSQKREVMLRDALLDCDASFDQGRGKPASLDEALAATADLSGVRLCHAEPAITSGKYPLYRALEPKT